MPIVFSQILLPIKRKFTHPHQCMKCKKWSIYGIISYSDEKEESVFICRKCQPVKLIPAQLPRKTEFRKNHFCMECKKNGNLGVLTYCSRCEEAEFICPMCLDNWLKNVEPERDDVTDFEEYRELTDDEEIKKILAEPDVTSRNWIDDDCQL